MNLSQRILVFAAELPHRTLNKSTLTKLTRDDKIRDSITSIKRIPRLPLQYQLAVGRHMDLPSDPASIQRAHAALPASQREHAARWLEDQDPDLLPGLPDRMEGYLLRWRGAPPAKLPYSHRAEKGEGIGTTSMPTLFQHGEIPQFGPFGSTRGPRGTSGALVLLRTWIKGKTEDFLTIWDGDIGEPGWIRDVEYGFSEWPPEEKTLRAKKSPWSAKRNFAYDDFARAVATSPWSGGEYGIFGNPPELIMHYDVPVPIPHKSRSDFRSKKDNHPIYSNMLRRLSTWVRANLEHTAPAIWDWMEQAKAELGELFEGNVNVGVSMLPKSQAKSPRTMPYYWQDEALDNTPLVVHLEFTIRASLQGFLRNPKGTFRVDEEEELHHRLMSEAVPVIRRLNRELTEAVLEQADELHYVNDQIRDLRNENERENFLAYNSEATSEEIEDAMGENRNERDVYNQGHDVDENHYQPESLSPSSLKKLVRFTHDMNEELHDRIESVHVSFHLENSIPDSHEYPHLEMRVIEGDAGGDFKSSYGDILETNAKELFGEHAPLDPKHEDHDPYDIERLPIRSIELKSGYSSIVWLKLNTRSSYQLSKWVDEWTSPKKRKVWMKLFLDTERATEEELDSEKVRQRANQTDSEE